MADFNALIAQGGMPIQFRSPVEQESRLMALQNAQQEQQMNALRMQEYQRNVAGQNALRRSLQESYNPATGEYDLTRARTLGAQYGADPMALQQFASGQETAAAHRENMAAQRAQREQATMQGRTRALGLALSTVLDDPSDERLNIAFSILDATGVNTAALRQQFAAMPIEQRRRVIQTYATGSEEGRKSLEFVTPKPERQDLGDRIAVVDMNPNSPTFRRELQSLPKGATPARPTIQTIDTGNEVITVQANPDTGEVRELRRTPKGLTPEQRRAAAQDVNTVANTITDAAGNVTLLNKFGRVIQPTAGGEIPAGRAPAGGGAAAPAAGAPAAAPATPAKIQGKPSATFEKTQAQRQQVAENLNTALFELRAAVEKGGLIDRSTGSGLGQMADIGMRFIGKATPGDIAINQLKPIADLVLKMVPRFEGPQSDKDTQSYKEAAGQLADAGMPREIRKAAANTIIRLMENRKGQFVTREMAEAGVGPGAAPPAGGGGAAGDWSVVR